MLRILTHCLLFSFLAATASFAQVRVTSNESMDGRINAVGEKNEWAVELKEDGYLRFTVASAQMEAWMGVVRPDGEWVRLKAVSGTARAYPANTGLRMARVGDQESMDLDLQSELELPRGKYRIIVSGYRKSIGAYMLTVSEPTIAAAAPPPPKKAPAEPSAPVAGSAKGNESADLARELASLRLEVQQLREEIRKLKERKN